MFERNLFSDDHVFVQLAMLRSLIRHTSLSVIFSEVVKLTQTYNL